MEELSPLPQTICYTSDLATVVQFFSKIPQYCCFGKEMRGEVARSNEGLGDPFL